MAKKLLNIVDNQGNILGVETRENIHKQGLLHKEIHVWLVTPNKEIIFQHRSKAKDTYPDFLDATVGGHVEIGSDYLDTAIKETEEETGLKVKPSDLNLLQVHETVGNDHVTGKINHALRAIYYYVYKGELNDLQSEEDKGVGFEALPIDELKNLCEEKRKKIIPNVISDFYLNLFEQMIKSRDF